MNKESKVSLDTWIEELKVQIEEEKDRKDMSIVEKMQPVVLLQTLIQFKIQREVSRC